MGGPAFAAGVLQKGGRSEKEPRVYSRVECRHRWGPRNEHLLKEEVRVQERASGRGVVEGRNSSYTTSLKFREVVIGDTARRQ